MKRKHILRKLKFCWTQKIALISIITEKGTSEIKDKCSPYISQCTPTDRNRAILHRKWIMTNRSSVSQRLWRDHSLQRLPFPHSISNSEPLRRNLLQVRIISKRDKFWKTAWGQRKNSLQNYSFSSNNKYKTNISNRLKEGNCCTEHTLLCYIIITHKQILWNIKIITCNIFP